MKFDWKNLLKDMLKIMVSLIPSHVTIVDEKDESDDESHPSKRKELAYAKSDVKK